MDGNKELFRTQNCKLSIVTQTTVCLNSLFCFVQLYEKHLSRCPKSGVAKDAFYLTPRRGFKYFDDGEYKKKSKLCTLGCKNSLIIFFGHSGVWYGVG